jgi:hypothetical protein
MATRQVKTVRKTAPAARGNPIRKTAGKPKAAPAVLKLVTTKAVNKARTATSALDKHLLRGRRPEQFDRSADEKQKAQQYTPEEHRCIVGSLHSSFPLLLAFWREKRGLTLHILQSLFQLLYIRQSPNAAPRSCIAGPASKATTTRA